MKLRPYQEQCIAGVSQAWEEFDRVLAVLPTGAGKTIVFSRIAQMFWKCGRRVLILAHREELIKQAADKLHKSTGLVAEIEKADDYASPDAAIVVASKDSLQGDRLARWPRDHFGLVIIDEAHHVLAESYRKLVDYWTGHKVLGVTATPDRGDKRELGTYFDAVGFEIGIVELIKQGYLAPITIKSLPIEINLGDIRSSMGDFKATDIAEAIEPYLPPIARAIKEHAANRRILIFAPLIATSQKMVRALEAEGIKAKHVDGQDGLRELKLAQFAAWEYQALSNAMLLTEGYDDPGIDCIVNLRPTRSRPLYAQILGRGTRINPLKEDLLVLDFLWQHERHRVCRPAHLVAASEEEAESMIAVVDERTKENGGPIELDLQDVQVTAGHAREKALRKRLEEQKGKKAKFISAEEFAMNHENLALAEYQPTLAWESQPITDKQAAALKRAGLDIATVSGRGHASRLLEIVFRETTTKLAHPNVVTLMKRMKHVCADLGIDPFSKPTQQQAGRFFAELKKRKEQKAEAQTQPTML